MAAIPLLASTAANAEASQIIGTVNGVINNINQSALIGSVAPTSLRNAVVGGDFTTNPWQRGTSFTGITNVLTYTADRFWALGGASSSISVSQGSTSPPPGFGNYLQFQRASSNANTAAIKLGYVMADNDPLPFQGLPFVISFWAKAGSNYSPAGNALTVTVGTGTAANGSAANYASAGWTGYAGVTLTNPAGATATSVALTTSWARYSLSGVIPTAALQIGFNFAMTPVGTAGTNDYFQITGIQFEVMPQGGTNPTPFERIPQQLVNQLCQRYYLQSAAPVSPANVGAGAMKTTTVALITVPLPVPMRATPTLVVPKKGATKGTFVLLNCTGTLTGTTIGTIQNGSAAGATSLIDPNVVIQVTSPSAVATAGLAVTYTGNSGGGSGTLQISSEL